MYKGIIINPAPPVQKRTTPAQRQYKALTREVVSMASAILALWISGLLPAVGAFLGTHQSQIILAAGLYLLLRYFCWVPLAALAVLVASPALVSRWWRQRRRGQPVARA